MTCSSRVSPPCAPRGPAEVVDVQLQHCIAESHGQGEHLLTNVHSADELALLETHFLGRSCSVSRLVSRPPPFPLALHPTPLRHLLFGHRGDSVCFSSVLFSVSLFSLFVLEDYLRSLFCFNFEKNDARLYLGLSVK